MSDSVLEYPFPLKLSVSLLFHLSSKQKLSSIFQESYSVSTVLLKFRCWGGWSLFFCLGFWGGFFQQKCKPFFLQDFLKSSPECLRKTFQTASGFLLFFFSSVHNAHKSFSLCSPHAHTPPIERKPSERLPFPLLAIQLSQTLLFEVFR